MSSQESPPKHKTTERWQRVARRIRVPLGFLTAALYLFELWRREPRPAAIAWSLLFFVLPVPLAPRVCVRPVCQEESPNWTQTGPYAYTRNPLYLGSILIAAGFCAVAPPPPPQLARRRHAGRHVPDHLCAGHLLRGALLAHHLPGFRRLLPPRPPTHSPPHSGSSHFRTGPKFLSGKFSADLYLRHREYIFEFSLGAALLYLRPCLGCFLLAAAGACS